MKQGLLTRTVVVVWVAAIVATVGGCSKTIWVTQTPDFYSPDLKTIAVAPFRNGTDQPAAGEVMADKVAACMIGNGTYKVFNRNDLRTLMDEKDLQIALGNDPAAASKKLHSLANVQAILVGTVTTYASTSESQPRQEPIYGYDNRGNQYIAGYRNYVWTRNEGNVSVTANLVRTSDGSTIATTAQPVWSRNWAEGSPAGKDRNACLLEASDAVATQLVEWFAPVRKQVKISVDTTLRTASELYDNHWTFKDTFNVNDKKMFVVVELPPACDRNEFMLTIVRKDGRTDLATTKFRWDKKHKGFGYDFDPSAIAAKGGGSGDYEVKFYSGPEPVLRRAFRIR